MILRTGLPGRGSGMMVRARAPPPARPGPRKVARLAGPEWPRAAALRPRRTLAGGGPQPRTVTETSALTVALKTLAAHWHAALPIGQALYWPEALPASPAETVSVLATKFQVHRRPRVCARLPRQPRRRSKSAPNPTEYPETRAQPGHRD